MATSDQKSIKPIDPSDKIFSLTISVEDEPDFVLDGIHFGRGLNIHNPKYKTTKLNVWKIIDQSQLLEELDGKQIGTFYDDAAYFISWHYTNTAEPVINPTVLYFHWKGENAKNNRYSPIPSHLPQDHPVERITQWSEPPVFLRLFQGKMIVHTSAASSKLLRLYMLRGEIAEEAHLYEVPCRRDSLRSRACFIAVNAAERTVTTWIGCKATEQYKSLINKIAANLLELFHQKLVESKFDLLEVDESDEFITKLDADGGDYFSLLIHSDMSTYDFTPRLFYLFNQHDRLAAVEIKSSHKSSFACAFPFLQSHLYSAGQPALFLLDNQVDIWLWHGWNGMNLDAFVAAKETALNYARKNDRSVVKCVFAGLEPIEFTNLFPKWTGNEAITEAQLKDGLENMLIHLDKTEGPLNVLN